MGSASFRDVQRTIQLQHREIFARIDGLTRNAERADLPWAVRALRVLLLRFAAQFDAHLAYEERELGPRIRELDAWGRAREAVLLSEHREQRRLVERVCGLAEDSTAEHTNEFSDAVLALADRLLEDMAHEEYLLAELARIDEDGHVDQMTG
jgi:hypothetical protein